MDLVPRPLVFLALAVLSLLGCAGPGASSEDVRGPDLGWTVRDVLGRPLAGRELTLRWEDARGLHEVRRTSGADGELDLRAETVVDGACARLRAVEPEAGWVVGELFGAALDDPLAPDAVVVLERAARLRVVGAEGRDVRVGLSPVSVGGFEGQRREIEGLDPARVSDPGQPELVVPAGRYRVRFSVEGSLAVPHVQFERSERVDLARGRTSDLFVPPGDWVEVPLVLEGGETVLRDRSGVAVLRTTGLHTEGDRAARIDLATRAGTARLPHEFVKRMEHAVATDLELVVGDEVLPCSLRLVGGPADVQRRPRTLVVELSEGGRREGTGVIRAGVPGASGGRIEALRTLEPATRTSWPLELDEDGTGPLEIGVYAVRVEWPDGSSLDQARAVGLPDRPVVDLSDGLAEVPLELDVPVAGTWEVSMERTSRAFPARTRFVVERPGLVRRTVRVPRGTPLLLTWVGGPAGGGVLGRWPLELVEGTLCCPTLATGWRVHLTSVDPKGGDVVPHAPLRVHDGVSDRIDGLTDAEGRMLVILPPKARTVLAGPRVRPESPALLVRDASLARPGPHEVPVPTRSHRVVFSVDGPPVPILGVVQVYGEEDEVGLVQQVLLDHRGTGEVQDLLPGRYRANPVTGTARFSSGPQVPFEVTPETGELRVTLRPTPVQDPGIDPAPTPEEGSAPR